MIYIVEGIYYFYLKFNKYLSSKIIYIFSILFILYNSYNLVKFHSYQNNVYLIIKTANKYFEIDYLGLANREAIEFIIKDSKENNLEIISIRTASLHH